MSEIFNQVTGDQDPLTKLLGKIPGFKGYVERQSRRASDKLLRTMIADHFEALWQRISGLQKELINEGKIAYIDDLESAAIKLRQFIDRVRTASYGYSAFFAAVKIGEEELAKLYEYDLALLNSEAEVANAIDNVESSIGTDGLKAAIRNLTTLSQQCVDAFNKRAEVILGESQSS